jgi:hypothetical protein
MRDQADLVRRAGDLKQTLLLALKHANAAQLDGANDQFDLESLARALEQARSAREQLEFLHKRLGFHLELGRVSSGAVNDETSRGLISLVRLGVDGGYDVTEVRRMIDQALGRA